MDKGAVWTLYDKLRTACLNVKYYEYRLNSVERVSFLLDMVVLATTPSSAVASLWLWKTPIGETVWAYVLRFAAVASIMKVLGGFTKKIKQYESLVQGYRMLYFDLSEIKRQVEEQKKYTKKMQGDLQKAIERERKLIIKNPETRESKRVKQKCEQEVRSQFPVDSFYEPEE